MKISYRINYFNFSKIKFDGSQNFDTIYFDSIQTCNLHCLYCHNKRINQKITEGQLLQFINLYVESTENFQIGCAMEPTMDKNMGKIALAVSKSRAKPAKSFRLQTNGTLLHRHDIDELKEAKINNISISFDTINETIHKELRGGSDLNKIIENIKNLRKKWPELFISLVTTVNKLNINDIENVSKFAIENGINSINLRKMFYFSNSRIIENHDKMKDILIPNSVFVENVLKLKSMYKNKLIINFMDEEKHENFENKINR